MGNAPKRRFKGFTDEWQQCKIKEICSVSTGKANTQDKEEGGKYPFYVRSAIIERSNSYLYDEEAVLTVGDGVGTGKVHHYVTGKYNLHQRVYRMFDFASEVYGKYFYLFFSNKFIHRVNAMTAKTSVDSVRLEMIAEMDFKFPSLAEQKKIADFFFTLDANITTQTQKLQKQTALKTAYLTEMFPAPGQTAPKRRFKGFADEWNEKELQECFNISNGYTPSKSNERYWTNGTIPWFRMEDIRQNGHILSDSIQKITPEAVKRKLFPANSILFATTATVGVHALIIVDSLANQQFTSIDVNCCYKINPLFAFYATYALADWCKVNINTGGLVAVNMAGFKKWAFAFPCLKEQTQIGNFFKTMDDLIAIETQKLEKLQALKQAYLSEMFV